MVNPPPHTQSSKRQPDAISPSIMTLGGLGCSENPIPTTGSSTVVVMNPTRPNHPSSDHLPRLPKRPFTAEATTICSSSSSTSTSSALYLLNLLLQCAEAVSSGNLSLALDLVLELSELSTPFGSSPQRVAAHFSNALRRLIFHSVLQSASSDHQYNVRSALSVDIPRAHSHHPRFLLPHAFQYLNFITPLVKFSHFTSNQAIFEALRHLDRVHIVDLDIMQGLQWPGLFHILASRPSPKLRSLRITAMGSRLDLLLATGRRLSDFASSLGLPFEFHPLDCKLDELDDPTCILAPGHATVVHWTHHRLYDVVESGHGAIKAFKALRPELVTIVEQDLREREDGGFLSRFVEALHYYSAMFDALGEGAGQGEEREVVESQVLGGEISNVVGGISSSVAWWRWSEDMEKAGFERVSLAGSPAAQATLLLGMQYPWKGYTLVEEENGCLRLGWKDLSLLTASAWRPNLLREVSGND